MKRTISILMSILVCSSISTASMLLTRAEENPPNATITQSATTNSFEQISNGTLVKVTEQAPENYVISEEVTKIGKGAFAGLTNIKTVSIPSTVIEIGNKAFSKCKSLESVVLPDSVTKLGEKAFYKCSSLKKIKLSNNLTEIKDSTFFGCKNITSVTIPENVTTIGYRAFIKCSSLKRIYFSKTNSKIKSMDDTAFDFRPESFRFSFNCQQNKYIAKYSKRNIIYATKDSHVFKKNYTIDQTPDYERPGYKSHHCKYCNNVDKYVKLKAKKFPRTAPVITKIEVKNGKTYVTLKKENKLLKLYELYSRVGTKETGYGYGGFESTKKIKGNTVIFDIDYYEEGANIIVRGYSKIINPNKIVTEKEFSMGSAAIDGVHSAPYGNRLSTKSSKVFVMK